MNLPQKVMLLNQSRLEIQGVVTLVEASRNRLRLTKMLSLTLSRSPQLLLLVPKREQKEAPVQLVSTLSSQVTQGQVNSTVIEKPQEVDPCFEGHCSLVTLVRPDHTSYS